MTDKEKLEEIRKLLNRQTTLDGIGNLVLAVIDGVTNTREYGHVPCCGVCRKYLVCTVCEELENNCKVMAENGLCNEFQERYGDSWESDVIDATVFASEKG